MSGSANNMTTPPTDEKVNEMSRENEVNNLSARLQAPMEAALRYIQHTAAGKQELLERQLSEAIAALSALPAGGEPVAEVLAGAFGTHYIACVDPNKLPVGTKLYTTPQPSAAEEGAVTCRVLTFDGERIAVPSRIYRRVHDALLGAALDAAVEAQGEDLARLRKYYEVTQHGIGMAKMALMRNDPSGAAQHLTNLSDEIDKALAAPADVGAQGDGSDWYTDETTGSHCVDWDADPARQLSIMLKRDGTVAFSVLVNGSGIYGDAMSDDFKQALTLLAAAPAAGKGVDDVVWRIEHEAEQFVDEKGMIYLRYLRDLLTGDQAALIRQPFTPNEKLARAMERASQDVENENGSL